MPSGSRGYEKAPAPGRAPHPVAELSKGLQHAPWPGSSLEGLGWRSTERGLHGREPDSSSAGLGAQGAGDTAQDPAYTRDRRRGEGPGRTARTPAAGGPKLSRSGAPPQSIQFPADWELQ